MRYDFLLSAQKFVTTYETFIENRSQPRNSRSIYSCYVMTDRWGSNGNYTGSVTGAYFVTCSVTKKKKDILLYY